MYKRQDNVVTRLRCNEKLSIPIIPSLHGTDLKIAFKIAQTGFAKLSLCDLGWFGSGIYFTGSVCYCLPYACIRREPAIILSYLTMAHVYPVDEDHLATTSLMGVVIKAGYNSHYVLTNKKGHVLGPSDKEICDELIVCQESQILPAFIIKLNTESALKELLNWERVTNDINIDDIKEREDFIINI